MEVGSLGGWDNPRGKSALYTPLTVHGCRNCTRIQRSPASWGLIGNYKDFEMGFIEQTCYTTIVIFKQLVTDICSPVLLWWSHLRSNPVTSVLALCSHWDHAVLHLCLHHMASFWAASSGFLWGEQLHNSKKTLGGSWKQIPTVSHALEKATGWDLEMEARLLFVLWRQMKQHCQARKQLDHSKIKIRRQWGCVWLVCQAVHTSATVKRFA